MAKLIFDIETAGENFDEFDETTKEVLTRWVEYDIVKDSDDYKQAIEKTKHDTVFSPLTAQIVAIGVLDYEKDKGVVYFQAPGENIEKFEENGIEFKPTTEKEMLERTLLELEATEIMKNSNFTNPRSIMTYPVFGFTFNIPFLE